MASLFKSHMQTAARVVNSTFGGLSTYTPRGDEEPLFTGYITINRNVAVYDEFKMLVGYGIEGSILKEDLPIMPEAAAEIVTDEGETFIVNQVMRETTAKWYVTLEVA